MDFDNHERKGNTWRAGGGAVHASTKMEGRGNKLKENIQFFSEEKIIRSNIVNGYSNIIIDTDQLLRSANFLPGNLSGS
jgi:hypothetical protein